MSKSVKEVFGRKMEGCPVHDQKQTAMGTKPNGNFRFVCKCGIEAPARDLLNIRLDHSYHTNPDLTIAMRNHRLLIFEWLDTLGLFDDFLNSPLVTPKHLYNGESALEAAVTFLRELEGK